MFACRIQQTETFMRTCITCGDGFMCACAWSLYDLWISLGGGVLVLYCIVHDFSLLEECVNCMHLLVAVHYFFGIVPDDFCNWLNLCWMFACRIQQTETFMRTCITCGDGFVCAYASESRACDMCVWVVGISECVSWKVTSSLLMILIFFLQARC